MEIVSEPDMRYVFNFLMSLSVIFIMKHFHIRRSPEEAADYIRTLQAILRSVGSSDGNMEQVRIQILLVWLCEINFL
jgi:Asp-tRNA(Asn)/Glu-tRNA(Gln) amidotransferase B subunit